jgi:hypothetical protein
MLKLIGKLKKVHVTPTRTMPLVLAECLRCRNIVEILEQNFQRHNREEREYCEHCIKDTFHNMTNTRIYRTWHSMKARCEWEGADCYRHYGGRGIKVCERWQSFENFYVDMKEGYSDDLTIERIDTNGNYEPGNCRWATNMEQQANKRNNRVLEYKGELLHMAELCRRTGVSKMKMVDRLGRGMTPEEAVASALASTYGTGRKATKGRGRTSTTSLTADPATGS